MNLRSIGKRWRTVRKAAGKAAGTAAKRTGARKAVDAISWKSVRPKLPAVKMQTQGRSRRISKLFKQVKRKAGL